MEALPEMEAFISVLWPECCNMFFLNMLLGTLNVYYLLENRKAKVLRQRTLFNVDQQQCMLFLFLSAHLIEIKIMLNALGILWT